MDLIDSRALVHDEFSDVDQLISDALDSEIELIPHVGKYLIDSGGKRLRPLMLLLSARLFGYRGRAHIELATVLELIHTATLLHDDVIDTSELRRGNSTANTLWGNPASVLVGDFLYSRAFQMLVKVNHPVILKLIADATNIIAEGEILQLMHFKNANVDEGKYLQVIRAKTGTLFSIAAQQGAILTDRSELEIHSMMQYGMHFGIAFQLIDDALDYSVSNDQLGKNCGDDLAEGNPTLPLLHVLKHGTSAQKDCVRQAIQEASREKLEDVLSAIESTGAISYIYDLAKQHAKQALDHLRFVPDSLYRQALLGLVEFAIDRNY